MRAHLKHQEGRGESHWRKIQELIKGPSVPAVHISSMEVIVMAARVEASKNYKNSTIHSIYKNNKLKYQ